MPKTTRLVGPPGTGKTTKLTTWARNLGIKYGPESVMICSLTRTAAKEIAGRDTGIPDTNVGTLHAHAFRAMNAVSPRKVFGTKKHIEEFNEIAPRKFELSESATNKEEGSRAKTNGDRVKEKIDLRIARMQPIEADEDREFMSLYSSFKTANGMVDFTDMLTYALESVDCPYEYVIADEAQDYSALEWAVIRKWSQQCQGAVVAGDADQCLYEWRGASVEEFFAFGDRREVLEQSYRVPAQVHDLSEKIVHRIRAREERNYSPTDRAGAAYVLDRRLLFEAVADERGSVMLLAPVGIATREWLDWLKKSAIPFHNPYRKEGAFAAAWNPLRRGSKGSTTARDRVEAFLAPPWDAKKLKAWMSVMEGLPRGVKKILSETDTALSIQGIEDILGTYGTAAALRGDLDWWHDNTLASKKKALHYCVQVAKTGLHNLIDEPKIIVGTIHSVKGGEADTVFVSPDLGALWREAWMYGQRDPILRMMFVAATRAKDKLVMLKPTIASATRTFQWTD
jgi:superfamily I DNA/RNA helicase